MERHWSEPNGERALLVTGVHELEEQVGATAGDGQVADLVDDQQRRPGIEPDLLWQSTLAFGLGEALDKLGQRGAVDAAPGLHRGDTEGRCEMGFAGAGRAEKMDHLGTADEVELRQGSDPLPIKRWLEAEAFERLDRHQLGGAQGDVDTAALACGELFAEQAVDGFDRSDLTLLQLSERVIQRLQRAGHPEADECAADAVEEFAHRGAPEARRRPTAS